MNSELITHLDIRTQDLIKELQVLLSEYETMRNLIKSQDIEKRVLEEKRKDIGLLQINLTERETQLGQDRQAVGKEQQEVFLMRTHLDKKKQLLEQEMKDWSIKAQERENKIADQEKLASNKLAEAQDLLEREKKVKDQLAEIAEERMLIEKEKKIDRERKERLDNREKQIEIETARITRLLTT